MLTIKHLAFDDLPKIAALHVRVWQQAYPGQVPQDYLDNLDVAARLERWQREYAKNKSDRRYGVLVARWEKEIIGFLSYGPMRDAEHDAMTEIYTLYILKEHWAKGIGYQLFRSACSYMKIAGINQAYLWVFDTNQHAFEVYQRWGGAIQNDQTKSITVGGWELRKTRVCFDVV